MILYLAGAIFTELLACLTESGERVIWVEAAVADWLAATRGPGKSYSDVILRLVELDANVKASLDLLDG